MSTRVVYLTDEQWRKIEPLIPKKPVGRKGGRPRADDRLVFEGILWILRTGARWKDLPDKYPNPSTCWRRLREWYETDVLKDMWRAFLSELDHDGILEWDEVFVDASFFPAKKRGAGVGKTKRGKGSKSVVLVDGKGVPLGSHTDSASPAEITLLDKALGEVRVPKRGPGRPRTRPTRVIGDKAYDSDPHRRRLKRRGISLLVPHRKNHRNVNRQDDRLWDRYRKRYTVERTFSWITAYRRIVVRYENHINMFTAFFQLACAMVTLKKCL